MSQHISLLLGSFSTSHAAQEEEDGYSLSETLPYYRKEEKIKKPT